MFRLENPAAPAAAISLLVFLSLQKGEKIYERNTVTRRFTHAKTEPEMEVWAVRQ